MLLCIVVVPAMAGRTIAFVNDAQTFHCEHVIDFGEIFRVFTISLARPPVATNLESRPVQPQCARGFRPRGQVSVVEAALDADHGVLPMTLGGLRISTRARRAARENSASAEIPSPGAITPPQYSPCAEMTSNVVAVPKSTTTHGPPYFSKAATPLTSLSAPSSAGLSTRMGIPVLMPGSTDIGFSLKYLSQTRRSVDSTGGTTDAMIMLATSLALMPCMSNKLRKVRRIHPPSAFCAW